MADADRAIKTVRMRTRKRARMSRSMRTAAMTTGLAAMLTTGLAEVPIGQRAGDIIPRSDRDLADGIYDAYCAWAQLEAFFDEIVGRDGRKHALDSSELSVARSRVDALKSKMDALKSSHAAQASSLSFDQVDDPKLAAKLRRCLEKNLSDAQARVAKMQKRLQPKSGSPEGSAPKKPLKAGPLAKSADRGKDLLGEALVNLVAKAKRSKAVRKKAAEKEVRTGLSSVTPVRYADDNEERAASGKRGGEKKSSKKKTSQKRSRKTVGKVVRRVVSGAAGPGAKAEQDSYLALAATGKVAESDAFYFETLPLELTGDVVAHADVGLFSSKSKTVAAAGDGEQGCLEVSTVGSAPAAAFVSLCGRQNAGRGGFEAYMLTPQGARGVTFLPGVQIAEFRMSIEGGTVQFEVRDAEVRGTWTLVDSVAKPADPLTFSIGAAFMGTGDEVGFDNLSVEAQVED